MTSAAIVGGTGLVGSNILTTLLSYPGISSVSAFARSQNNLPTNDPHSRLRQLLNTDSSKWIEDLPSLSPPPSIFFSGLATTRAQAGGFDKQYAIDYDLNLALAKAAKDAGAKVYVLISSGGANKNGMMGYIRMKGELEESVAALGFERCVLVRPGLICGQRNDTRTAEATMRAVANFAGKINHRWLKDTWAQDANVIGRAAVKAGMMALEGKAPEGSGPWIVGQADIVRLGRTEWEKV